MWYSNLFEHVILKETYENIKYPIFSYFQGLKLFCIIVIIIYTVNPWKTGLNDADALTHKFFSGNYCPPSLSEGSTSGNSTNLRCKLNTWSKLGWICWCKPNIGDWLWFFNVLVFWCLWQVLDLLPCVYQGMTEWTLLVNIKC